MKHCPALHVNNLHWVTGLYQFWWLTFFQVHTLTFSRSLLTFFKVTLMLERSNFKTFFLSSSELIEFKFCVVSCTCTITHKIHFITLAFYLSEIQFGVLLGCCQLWPAKGLIIHALAHVACIHWCAVFMISANIHGYSWLHSCFAFVF